jgi:hypothetical protein
MKKIRLITTLAMAAMAVAAHAQFLELNINSDTAGVAQTPVSDPSLTHFVPVPEPTPYFVFGLGALVLALGRLRSLRSRKRQ